MTENVSQLPATVRDNRSVSHTVHDRTMEILDRLRKDRDLVMQEEHELQAELTKRHDEREQIEVCISALEPAVRAIATASVRDEETIAGTRLDDLAGKDPKIVAEAIEAEVEEVEQLHKRDAVGTSVVVEE